MKDFKEIKLIHLVMAVILVLLLVAVFQWTKLPKSVPSAAAPAAVEVNQATELPVLPQNERYNSNTVSPFLKDLPSFEDLSREEPPKDLEPKDKITSSRKSEL